MKVYCYTYFLDKILKEGYLSVSKNPSARDVENGVYRVYRTMANADTEEEITAYLESTFKGRTRSICCVANPAPEKDYTHPYLDRLVKNASVVSFDLDKLIADGLVEKIYCKDQREAIKNANGDKIDENENIYEVSADEVKNGLADWDETSDVRYSPYAQVKHYILVLTKGYIPPEYINVEKR